MSSMQRIEAERTVDRLEHDAETQWRIDGQRRALGNVTNDVLRDALMDCLADVLPMKKLVDAVNEGATETLDGMRDSDLVKKLRTAAEDAGVDGEEVINAHDVVKAARPEKLAGNMLELLEAAVRFYSSRSTAVAGEAPAILQTPLPPRTKRLRTGATTIPLAFLFSHEDGVNVAVNDMMPSTLAPVIEKKKPGRQKKAA